MHTLKKFAKLFGLATGWLLRLWAVLIFLFCVLWMPYGLWGLDMLEEDFRLVSFLSVLFMVLILGLHWAGLDLIRKAKGIQV